jgi:hypothetical protein
MTDLDIMEKARRVIRDINKDNRGVVIAWVDLAIKRSKSEPLKRLLRQMRNDIYLERLG